MRSKSLLYLYTVCLSVVMFASCDTKDEDERFIEVEEPHINRPVLIEDFTGQKCINCPTAAVLIESLVEEYGDEAVVAVSIHGGSMSIDEPMGLANEFGKMYNKYWNVESWPSGLINRKGGVIKTDMWMGRIAYEMALTPHLDLEIENTYVSADNKLAIQVKVTGLDKDIEGKLQIWLTEDHIKAVQLMPDGKPNTAYEHNHVLRTAVNGEWGESIAVEKEKTKILTAECDLSGKSWNLDNLYVVAFVYDDNGVQQVARKAVVPSNC